MQRTKVKVVMRIAFVGLLAVMLFFAGLTILHLQKLNKALPTNIASADTFETNRVYPIINGNPVVSQGYAFTAQANHLQLDGYYGSDPNVVIPVAFYCGDGTTYTNTSSFTFGFNKTYRQNNIIETFVVDGTVYFSGSFESFAEQSTLEECDFGSANTTDITSMKTMFHMCQSLTSLNLSSFDTSNVTNMSHMFAGCSSLESLDLTNFDTSKVESMQCMFHSCLKLETIDVSSFDTSNVTQMFNMFYMCNSITSLDLSNFNTSKVEYMDNMFWHCIQLIYLNISSFYVGNSVDVEDFISDCTNLASIHAPYYFGPSYNLEGSGWKRVDNGSTVTNLQNTSGVSYRITKLPQGLDSSYVYPIIAGELDTTQYYTFTANANYLQLNNYLGSNPDVVIPTIFYCGDGTIYANTSSFTFRFNQTYKDNTVIDTFNVNGTVYFSGGFNNFAQGSGLQQCNFGDANTSGVTLMNYMFSNCSSLTSLNVSGFDTSNVTNMQGMFNNCSVLASLNISNFNTSNVTSMSAMFSGCCVLASIDVSGFNTDNVEYLSGMFKNCIALTSIDISNFNTSNYKILYNLFSGCSNLTSVNLCDFNLSNATNINSMFSDCAQLTSLDLSSLYVSSSASVENLLSGCTNLVNINVPYNFGPSYDLGSGWRRVGDGASVTDLQNTTNASFEITKLELYEITFKNYDNTTLQEEYLKLGTMPTYTGEAPTKPATVQYSYTFNGWDPEIETVSGDAEYTATYSSVVREYTIIFKNYDNSILEQKQVAYGDTPEYTGEAPTKPSTIDTVYTFNGWLPEIEVVTGDAVYTTTYSSAVREYTITFKNYDNSILEQKQVAYGDTPEYTGEIPTKPATAQFTYTFNNEWSPSIVAVVGEAAYTAQFSQTVNEYTITFKNYDDTVLEQKQVAFGTIPTYNGATPVKPATAQYSYMFSGWTTNLVAVTGEAEYTAGFLENVNNYTIVFKNYDNEVLQQTQVLYGQMPAYNAENPTKPPTDSYVYRFNGWDNTLTAVTGDATYTATYQELKKLFVSIECDENLSYTISPEKDYYLAGDAITINVAISDKYVIDTIEVNGKEAKLENGELVLTILENTTIIISTKEKTTSIGIVAIAIVASIALIAVAVVVKMAKIRKNRLEIASVGRKYEEYIKKHNQENSQKDKNEIDSKNANYTIKRNELNNKNVNNNAISNISQTNMNNANNHVAKKKPQINVPKRPPKR
ncbi:MAG: BspA family leucine-rich repeat surface protein [Clostridia bacterium]|nr:BspA family leucine-rich repeat surface protein [Clostridia bacterium]